MHKLHAITHCTDSCVSLQVTVDMAGQGGAGRKKAMAQVRLLSLQEAEDGWESIQDAQNAAACLALFTVCEVLSPCSRN